MSTSNEVKALKAALAAVEDELNLAVYQGRLPAAIEALSRRNTLASLLIQILERKAA
jgi:hypothetical protein